MWLKPNLLSVTSWFRIPVTVKVTVLVQMISIANDLQCINNKCEGMVEMLVCWMPYCLASLAQIQQWLPFLGVYNIFLTPQAATGHSAWGCLKEICNNIEGDQAPFEHLAGSKAIWPLASLRINLISSSWLRHNFGLVLAALDNQADTQLAVHDTPMTLTSKLVPWQA